MTAYTPVLRDDFHFESNLPTFSTPHFITPKAIPSHTLNTFMTVGARTVSQLGPEDSTSFGASLWRSDGTGLLLHLDSVELDNDFNAFNAQQGIAFGSLHSYWYMTNAQGLSIRVISHNGNVLSSYPLIELPSSGAVIYDYGFCALSESKSVSMAMESSGFSNRISSWNFVFSKINVQTGTIQSSNVISLGTILDEVGMSFPDQVTSLTLRSAACRMDAVTGLFRLRGNVLNEGARIGFFILGTIDDEGNLFDLHLDELETIEPSLVNIDFTSPLEWIKDGVVRHISYSFDDDEPARNRLTRPDYSYYELGTDLSLLSEYSLALTSSNAVYISIISYFYRGVIYSFEEMIAFSATLSPEEYEELVAEVQIISSYKELDLASGTFYNEINLVIDSSVLLRVGSNLWFAVQYDYHSDRYVSATTFLIPDPESVVASFIKKLSTGGMSLFAGSISDSGDLDGTVTESRLTNLKSIAATIDGSQRKLENESWNRFYVLDDSKFKLIHPCEESLNVADPYVPPTLGDIWIGGPVFLPTVSDRGNFGLDFWSNGYTDDAEFIDLSSFSTPGWNTILEIQADGLYTVDYRVTFAAEPGHSVEAQLVWQLLDSTLSEFRGGDNTQREYNFTEATMTMGTGFMASAGDMFTLGLWMHDHTNGGPGVQVVDGYFSLQGPGEWSGGT